jgi:uncharacterized protein (DUF736 family)
VLPELKGRIGEKAFVLAAQTSQVDAAWDTESTSGSDSVSEALATP